MADINNSIATQIQVPQIDVMNPLLKAAELRNLQAEGGLREQALQHNQFLYDQGGGYSPSELQTQALTQQQHLENAGRIGNAYLANPNDSSWSTAVDEAEKVGLIRGGSLEKAQYLSLPPAQRANVARALQQAGQPSQSSIEQGGQPSYNRAFGQRTGDLSAGLQPAPGNGPPAAPGEAPRPAVPLAAAAKAVENQPDLDKAQLAQYNQEQLTAPTVQATLQQMRNDAARVRTGKGAQQEQDARKWLVAAGDIFPALKGLSDKYSSSAAAFESLDKNAGIVAREAQKEVKGTAASELDAISSSLANHTTTNKGIEVNIAQLQGLQRYKRVRADQASQYYSDNRTLQGFAPKFDKTSGPAAWIYLSLPSEERQSIKASLSKTSDGKQILQSLAHQIGYIHENKLDEGLE